MPSGAASPLAPPTPDSASRFPFLAQGPTHSELLPGFGIPAGAGPPAGVYHICGEVLGLFTYLLFFLGRIGHKCVGTLSFSVLHPNHLFYMVFPLNFPGGSEGKVSAYNAGDPSLIPGLGRSPGEGNDSPLQYSCLENPMDGGAQ